MTTTALKAPFGIPLSIGNDTVMSAAFNGILGGPTATESIHEMPASSATITETQPLDFRTAVSLSLLKPSWPNPEQSIGRQCESVGGLSCWETAGPALELADRLLPEIASLLAKRNEYLNEGEPVPRLIMYGMFMIGRTGNLAWPTILFSCQSKSPRKKALKIVKESEISKNLCGVKLAHNSRPPLAQSGLVLLAEGRRGHGTCNTTAYIGISNRGSPLLVISSSDGPESGFMEATLGGILAFGGTQYALTAAHPFAQSMQINAEVTDGKNEIDITFDEDPDEDSSDISSSINTTFEEENPGSPETDPRDFIPTGLADDDGIVPAQFRVVLVGNKTITVTKLGKLAKISTDFPPHDRDWALLNIGEFAFGPLEESVGASECSGKLVQLKPRTEVKIIALLRQGNVHGVLSVLSSFMRLSSNGKFEEVWPVRLDEVTRLGDCGSWVIDAVSRDLYGHIVAGHSGSNVAYVVPAVRIFDDITQCMGIAPTIFTKKDFVIDGSREDDMPNFIQKEAAAATSDGSEMCQGIPSSPNATNDMLVPQASTNEDRRPTQNFPCLFRVDQRVWLKITGQRGFWGPMIIHNVKQTDDRLNWEYQLRFHTNADDELYKGGAWISQKDLNAKGAGKNS